MNKFNLTSLSCALLLCSNTLLANELQLEQVAATAVVTNAEIDRQASVYIWPEVHPAAANFVQSQIRSSDEYWQVVSADELHKGIKVHTTSDALVRLASYANYDSGAKYISEPLNPNMLQMSTQGQPLLKQQIISNNQMKQAGFDDASVALKLESGSGSFTLKTSQPLRGNERYLLHVKEKNSPFKLTLGADSNVTGSIDNNMALDMSLAGKKLQNSEVKVRVLAPNGEQVPVDFNAESVTFNRDLTYFGARDGLYELEVDVLTKVNGQSVKRTLKFPFANTVKTAALTQGMSFDQKSGYQLPIEVLEPGRYNVTATLQGQNSSGDLVRLQTVSSAAYFDQSGALSLPFTMAKFQQFDNFELVDIKLTDQSRMMVQQVLSDQTQL